MRKKALILDLDNTIFPVRSIGDTLFAPLFELIKNDKDAAPHFEKIREEVMRRPFQLVAEEFHFNKALLEKGTEILRGLSYNGKIEPFPDYKIVQQLNIDKYLVTTGFTKMQQSKVDSLQLQHDFKEIHIIDPEKTDKVKKDVFADIIARHHYDKSEVLIVGDDLHSEIQAARELGVDAVLYNKLGFFNDEKSVTKITDFAELTNYL